MPTNADYPTLGDYEIDWKRRGSARHNRQLFYAKEDATGAYRKIERIRTNEPGRVWIAYAGESGEERHWQLTARRWQEARHSGEILSPEEHKRRRASVRQALTCDPGTERSVSFIKRSDGTRRDMRFRYDPEREGRFGFDPKAKGLLPVWDLDKEAPRFVNLDGVLA